MDQRGGSEAIPSVLSGEWQITDGNGNVFEYVWDHKVGELYFAGSQKGGKECAGQVQGNIIEWEVADVYCKGELTTDGTRITNGAFWSKDSGQALGTFVGEKMELNLTGSWQIKDDRGDVFEYKFKHKRGDKTFGGSQKGGKEVAGCLRGNVILWEVNGVCCKGELTSDGAHITNGTYWKRSSGKPLGTFVGENCREKAGDTPLCPAKHPMDLCHSRKDLTCKECRRRIPGESGFFACKKCWYHVCQGCLQKRHGRKQRESDEKSKNESKWRCKSCGTENYPTWSECFGCKRPRPEASSTSSDRHGKRSRSREHRGGKRPKRRSSSSSMERAIKAVTGTDEDPEIQQGKAEALQELKKIKSTESKDTRESEFKALLRRWHPDKNLDRQEVAKQVFQFLLKCKRMLKDP